MKRYTPNMMEEVVQKASTLTQAIKNVRIADCAEVLSGFSAKGAIVDEPGGTLQVITAQHLTKGEPYRYKEEHRIRIVSPRSIEKYLLEPGDILFMSRGANNYAVLLEDIPRPAIAPLTFFIIKPERSIINPAYLTWCLDQEPVKVKLNEIRTGAGSPMLPRREFAEIIIPLPVMVVQQQIADLAHLQMRERVLLQRLFEEAERLQRLTGKQLLAHLTRKKQGVNS